MTRSDLSRESGRDYSAAATCVYVAQIYFWDCDIEDRGSGGSKSPPNGPMDRNRKTSSTTTAFAAIAALATADLNLLNSGSTAVTHASSSIRPA